MQGKTTEAGNASSGFCGNPDFDFSIGRALQGQPYGADNELEVVAGGRTGQKPCLGDAIPAQPKARHDHGLAIIAPQGPCIGHGSLGLQTLPDDGLAAANTAGNVIIGRGTDDLHAYLCGSNVRPPLPVDWEALLWPWFRDPMPVTDGRPR